MANAKNTKLASLASMKLGNAEIESAVGHALSPAELEIVRRQRAIDKLKRAAARGKKPKTEAERQRKSRARKRSIECPMVEDMQRRERLEKDPEAWMLHYTASSFDAPFSDGHKRLIASIMEAAESGEGTATAQPRGEGKTTVCTCGGFNLQARGIKRFTVLVGWKHSDAAASFKSWLWLLSDSPEFAADYPEIATPFHHSTHATALAGLTWANTIEELGVKEGEQTGASVDTMHKVITLPNNLGAIAARSAKGDAKGLFAILKNGERLRPDFLLIDDAQDPKRADNEVQVLKTVDILENVFLGMAGPRTRLSAAVACTVEHDGDVSEHWLKKEGWLSVRVSRIGAWPDGSAGGTWESEEGCGLREMWDEWNRIRTTRGAGNGQKGANAYFEKHREKMTGKMEVSWEHRYDPKHDVCAIDAAMRDWYKMGPSVFARGQQNRPIKEGTDTIRVTAAQVAERIDKGRTSLDVPEWTDKIIASTDINPSYALTTTVVAFGVDQRAAVLWYGTHKLMVEYEIALAQKKSAIMLELQNHGHHLKSLGLEIDMWMIDGGGGGNPEKTVQTFSENSRNTVGIVSMPSFGVTGKELRIRTKDKEFERSLIRTGKHRWDRWCRFDQDHWGEVQLHSWMGAMGAPGTCDLPAGNHYGFAEQVCREWIISKEMKGEDWKYKWHTESGKHDYPDCIKMAFVGAALNGIGTGGQVIRRSRRKKYSQKDLRR